MMTLAGSALGTSSGTLKDIYQENHHMLLAQARAMTVCHAKFPELKIGPAPNISVVYPKTNKPEDVAAAQLLSSVRNWLYLDMAVYTTLLLGQQGGVFLRKKSNVNEM